MASCHGEMGGRPPPDFLNHVMVWVQIRNIPVNHYIEKAITTLGDLVGKTELVAFDATKPHIYEFVRVRVKVDVTKPLRRSKVINLKYGESTTVYYNYEKIQRRCTNCQRLTHDREHCPKLQRGSKNNRRESIQGSTSTARLTQPYLQEDDPLYGVLREDQVGFDPASGAERIATEVLDEMRRYLRTCPPEERHIREERVKVSVRDVRKDPVAVRSFLRLEKPPSFTTDLNLGKGLVFEYELQEALNANTNRRSASSGKGRVASRLSAMTSGIRDPHLHLQCNDNKGKLIRNWPFRHSQGEENTS